MAELRQNALTGRWVAVAQGRGGRPVEASESGGSGASDRPRRDPDCPFCPGNEDALPAVLWELPDGGEPGWRCRAVPNRYAAFSGAETATADGTTAQGAESAASVELREEGSERPLPGRVRSAVGLQEVLIESPRHDRAPETMSRTELEGLVELYLRRLGRLVRDRPDLSPCLFRNEGAGAGASLRHPHAQLVATRDVPSATAVREGRQRRYRDHHGRCLLCELPDVEPDGTARTVLEDPRFRVEVPWAAERPLEVWIVPRGHRASFSGMDPDETSRFARLLGRVLRAVRILTGGVDYNYIVHSAAGVRSDDPALHWFLQIRPVTAKMAGFELGSGVVVSPTDPLDDAERLRHALERVGTEGTKGDRS